MQQMVDYKNHFNQRLNFQTSISCPKSALMSSWYLFNDSRTSRTGGDLEADDDVDHIGGQENPNGYVYSVPINDLYSYMSIIESIQITYNATFNDFLNSSCLE